MSWLQKWSGLGKKEDTLLTLRLRLSRWRHLLKAKQSCLELLADLKDKSQGEYIFDSQYIYSTLGHIFQKAQQMTYDRLVLLEDQDNGMVLWLDQIKDQATSFLDHFPRNRRALKDSSLSGPGSPEGLEQPKEENLLQNLNDFEQEPEFQMLKGLLKILDPLPGNNGKPLVETLEKTTPLREGLQRTHEEVLRFLMKPGLFQNWITGGLALPIQNLSPFTFYLMDLGKDLARSKSEPKLPGWVEPNAIVCSPWPFLLKGLSLSSTREGAVLGRLDLGRSLLMVCNQDALFLAGSSVSGPIIMDVVLTSIRELNHFFIHCEVNSKNLSLLQDLEPLYNWTYRRKGSVFEVFTFNRSPQEIENLIIKAGQGFNLWMNKGDNSSTVH
jgi:hypothetical protein